MLFSKVYFRSSDEQNGGISEAVVYKPLGQPPLLVFQRPLEAIFKMHLKRTNLPAFFYYEQN